MSNQPLDTQQLIQHLFDSSVRIEAMLKTSMDMHSEILAKLNDKSVEYVTGNAIKRTNEYVIAIKKTLGTAK